jgi:hypothetical protein
MNLGRLALAKTVSQDRYILVFPRSKEMTRFADILFQYLQTCTN